MKARPRRGHRWWHTLRRRLLVSHGLVASIGLLMLAVVLAVALSVRGEIVELVERRSPAAAMSLEQLAALEAAEAALNGWVALGDPALRKRWEEIWSGRLRPGLGSFRELTFGAADGDGTGSVAALDELDATFERLHDAQQRAANSVLEAAPGQQASEATRAHLAEAQPLALRARALLSEMATRQTRLLYEQGTFSARMIDSLIIAALAICIAGILAAAWASSRAATHVAKPIGALSTATRDLVEGRLTSPLRFHGDDEIAELVRSFNRMFAAVQRGELALRDEIWSNGEFLASVSHAARTPLNGVIGLAEVILQGELEEEQRERIERLRSSGETLLRLLNDLFDYSRLEIGRLDLANQPFELSSCVRAAFADTAGAAAERNVVLSALIAPGTPEQVVGDPAATRRVLTRLVRHAIGFAEAGEVVVHIDSQATSDDHAELHFSVVDRGKPIPTAELERLFEPFTRVEPDRAGRYGGTGLELSIASRLVELMDGSMWFSALDADGPAFHIRLPVGTSEDASATRTAPLALFANEDSPFGDTQPRPFERVLHILIAEDEPINRQVAHELLRRRGHHVTNVENGYEAVDLLRSQPAGSFDLVLMDVLMPVMDGYEATAAIRELDRERGDRTRIIAMTAHAREGDRQRCLEAGMDDYLSKPIRAAQLYETVESCAAT